MGVLIERFGGSITRHAITYVAGLLGGVMDADAATAWATTVVPLILALAWSLYKEHAAHRKFLAALDAPAGMSEAEFKAYGDD